MSRECVNARIENYESKADMDGPPSELSDLGTRETFAVHPEPLETAKPCDGAPGHCPKHGGGRAAIQLYLTMSGHEAPLHRSSVSLKFAVLEASIRVNPSPTSNGCSCADNHAIAAK